MKRRKPYAEEFKQEAARLVTKQGMVVRDLDVTLDTLHRWLRQARSTTNSSASERISSAEIAQLRRDALSTRASCRSSTIRSKRLALS